MMAIAPVLAYYDQTRCTIVSAYSSWYGIGAIFLGDHDGTLKPVAFTSRILSAQDWRYTQVDKERLTCVWAWKKISRYLVGLPIFRLHTDHNPLVPPLTTNDLTDALVHCQHLLMRMPQFNPKAMHVPSKQLMVVDMLSMKPRVNTTAESNKLEQEVELNVDAVFKVWLLSRGWLEGIKKSTDEDVELCLLAKYIMMSWPNSPEKLPRSLLRYHTELIYLSFIDGIVIHGDRIFIPKAMRSDILEQLHKSHQGLERICERAHYAVWGPGISHGLKTISENCAECRQHHPLQRHEPLRPSQQPTSPWS